MNRIARLVGTGALAVGALVSEAQADTQTYRIDFFVDQANSYNSQCIAGACEQLPADLTPLHATVEVEDWLFAAAASYPMLPRFNAALPADAWRFDDAGALSPPSANPLAQVVITGGRVVDFTFQLGRYVNDGNSLETATFVASDGTWDQQWSRLEFDPLVSQSAVRRGSYQISAVPEPGTYVLMVWGLCGLAFMARRASRRT